MTSTQTVGAVEKYRKPRGNGGHELSGSEQEQQTMGNPPLGDDLSLAISDVAYFRAEARGFEPGHELEDWVEAERQVAGVNSADH
jgi:hypothetical protein